jgi:ubiquinone/menaquinone biosynthesis C-methylase UbiE
MIRKNNINNNFYRHDYEKVYSDIRIRYLLRLVHKKLEKPFLNKKKLEILEVGAGHGQHFALTKLRTKRYVELDIQEFKNLDVNNLKSIQNGRIRTIGNAITLKEFKANEFNGIIATCLLAHLSDMELALKNWRRVVRNGGLITVYVPCEPGILLRLARFFTTKKWISNLGYNHSNVHWTEHRNHFLGMRTAISRVFNSDLVEEKKFPFSYFIWDLNLYSIFIIQVLKDKSIDQ